MARFRKTNSGQSLVEFLVAAGIAAAILPAILTGFITSREGKVNQDLRLRGTSYLREAQEATRVVREADWNAFAVNGIYHPVISGNTWGLVSGQETISDFTRSIVISDTAPADPSIKLVTITVSWGGSAISSVSSSEYFTRYLGNNNVRLENQTVDPAAGGFGNWCQPIGPSVTNVDLDRQGHPTTISAFESDDGIGNRVLAGTGANSSGPDFSNIEIIGNSPPAVSFVVDFNGTPQLKVNGVFGGTDYAYLATDNNSKEVVILNLTSPYSEAGSFNSPGNNNGKSVSVSGNIGYMTAGNSFYTFDLSSKSGSRGQLGTVTLSGTGEKIVVVGSYVYVAISGATIKMQIIDVANPASPALAGAYVNSNLSDGRDVFVNPSGSRAYLATANSSTQPEFFILDTTNKASPTLITGGTYDTGGMDPYGVIVVSGEKAVIVGTGGNEYQVFSIAGDSVSSCPNQDSFLNIDSGVYAVSSVLQSDGHAYSYIATGDSAAEIKIIEGGSGGGGGSGTGTFESAPFDAGHDVAFNYFSGTSDPNLSYKIALKQGSCASNTFADSDFVSFPPGPLPLTTIGSGYVNPGQCLVYRAISSGSSPIIFTISFNYSP